MWVFMMTPWAPVEAWPVLERHSTVTYTVFQAYMLGNSRFNPAAPSQRGGRYIEHTPYTEHTKPVSARGGRGRNTQ